MRDRKDFFDRHASSWDQRLRYEERASQLLEVVKWFELNQGDSVLDVGTGTGILLPLLRETIGPEGRLVGMDFSFNMLGEAKKRPCDGGKILLNASVEAIPSRANQFDRITCFSAFPHFPHKSRALSEMTRVLKNGGKLYMAHLRSIEEINQFHKEIGGPVAHDLLPHPERIKGLMKDAGLFEISIINQPGKFLAQGRKVSCITPLN